MVAVVTGMVAMVAVMPMVAVVMPVAMAMAMAMTMSAVMAAMAPVVSAMMAVVPALGGDIFLPWYAFCCLGIITEIAVSGAAAWGYGGHGL